VVTDSEDLDQRGNIRKVLVRRQGGAEETVNDFCGVGFYFTCKPSIRADMPLHTSGSILFPDKIEWEEKEQRYKLGFMTRIGVKSAATYLYIVRADLEKEFEKFKKS